MRSPCRGGAPVLGAAGRWQRQCQHLRTRWLLLRAAPEDGQVSLLMMGMFVAVIMLVLAGVGVTSVQLSRIHLMDAADAAALDASDALDEQTAYGSGVGGGVPLTDALVQQAASAHLQGRTVPTGISAWSVESGTGSPDGRTAVVRLQGRAQIPLVSTVLSAFGGGVTITVESRARSDLE